jgi:hypothetical protein
MYCVSLHIQDIHTSNTDVPLLNSSFPVRDAFSKVVGPAQRDLHCVWRMGNLEALCFFVQTYFIIIIIIIIIIGARGSVVVKALCCKPEGRGFKSR